MPALKFAESTKKWALNFVLTGEESYSGKRSLHVRNIVGSLVALGIFTVFCVGYNDYLQDKRAAEQKAEFAPAIDLSLRPIAQTGSSPGSRDPYAGLFNADAGRAPRSGAQANAQRTTVARSHNAPQVIRPGENGSDPDSALPMGFGIPVTLVNAIQSGSAGSPVIAQVIQDVMSHDGITIPASTRAIGQASVDEASRRIQIHFHTLVYPEGDQHTLDALALMPDGSAGLQGNYHSGSGTRELGRFLGTFIGGMAQGMTERESGGMFGGYYEDGSVKNGLMTGISQSAQDQTKVITDELSATKPTMSLASGQSFILYLEKEYQP